MAMGKLGVLVCYTVAFVLIQIGAIPAVSARNVNVQSRSSGSNKDIADGLQADLLLQGQKGLSGSERLVAEILRGHARANSLGAIVSSGASSYESPMSIVPGSFAMNLTIGTPGQTFIAIADTGSDLVWVQSIPCSGCFKQPDPLFDPSKSSTFKKLPCTSPFCKDLPEHSCTQEVTGPPSCYYTYQYGDLSETQGTLASETITLTSTTGGKSGIASFVFGAGTHNSGSFQQVDGLVGLGKGPLSLTSQLGTLFSNKFSYCLVPFGSQFEKPSPIIFGDAAVPSGNVQYTPFVDNPVQPSFYYVNLESISVDGKTLDIPATTFAIDSSGRGGFLFDSGTTITYLAPAGYQPLEQALRQAIKYPEGQSPAPGTLKLCYAPNTENPSFPSITFHFEGGDYVLSSEDSFMSLTTASGKVYCLGMSMSTFPVSIFGNVQQANYHILYDRANSRMGFLSAHCGIS